MKPKNQECIIGNKFAILLEIFLIIYLKAYFEITMRMSKEDDIADKLDELARGKEPPELGIKDFVARKVNGEWVIEFTYRNYVGYKLHTKYGIVRKFPRINGIEKWMIKMGITHFSVYL